MESALRRSAGAAEEEGAIKMEEKKIHSNCDQEQYCQNKHMLLKDNQLELAKAEMCEVRQENHRLKLYLDKMMMDYQTLKRKFNEQNQAHKMPAVQELGPEDSEFVSLSLGRTLMSFPIDQTKIDDYDGKNVSTTQKADQAPRNINLQDKEGLVKLGLDFNFDVHPSKFKPETTRSPSNPSLDQNSSEEVKDDLAGETKWSPKKGVKTVRSNADDIENSVKQNPAKKARVSVRVRCDTPTMNDGCQWRKYGQKIAKGNPCPRAYYRCTVAPSCPVRKQVQRCSEDMSILITTYEGTHSHPLPVSATAMASTTSAAAVMLLSGSSSSSEPGPTPSATAIAAQQLHGLNFYLSKPSPPFYLLNSSNTSSPSCPTITLDLANTSSSSSHFNPLSNANNFTPRYNSNSNYYANLNFTTTTLESSTSPWNYNAHQSPFNQTGSLNFGSRPPQENLYHSFMQKKNGNYNVTPTQQSSHSIEAATQAITSDPNFQSALAAALTSIIGTNNNGSQNVKLEQPFPMVKSSRFGLQPSNLQSSNSRLLLSPILPVSSSKSNSSASPGDTDS